MPILPVTELWRELIIQCRNGFVSFSTLSRDYGGFETQARMPLILLGIVLGATRMRHVLGSRFSRPKHLTRPCMQSWICMVAPVPFQLSQHPPPWREFTRTTVARHLGIIPSSAHEPPKCFPVGAHKRTKGQQHLPPVGQGKARSTQYTIRPSYCE
jgi:hypothetical protein